MGRVRSAGYSLIELMIVVVIMGITISIAGFSYRTLKDRFEVESQVRTMHVDMLRVRHRAFQLNKTHYITVTTADYQVTEDTNDSGGVLPDAGDMALWTKPKPFRFQSNWAGILVIDGRGMISTSLRPLLSTSALTIRFESEEVNPEYDCISIGPTRLRVGRWSGTKCVPR